MPAPSGVQLWEAQIKAIICESYEAPVRLGDWAEPVAGAGELLVEVLTVGLGHADLLTVSGKYQVKRPTPFVPGVELVGRVLSVGEGVAPHWVGKRVVGLTLSGGLAERAVLRESLVVELPEAVAAEAAAGCLINYATMVYGYDMGRLRASDTVLVLGAGGGIGLAAVDLARMHGAKVIAGASSAGKRDAAIAQGAALAIDYSAADWRTKLEAEIGKGKIDVIVDPVGGGLSETAFRCLAPGGRHLVLGFSSGTIPSLPLNLPLLKQSYVVGVDWGGAMRADHGVLTSTATVVVHALAYGALKPAAARVVALENAAAGFLSLEGGANPGKLVVRVAGG